MPEPQRRICVPVPEDTITSHITFLLEQSAPGSTLHHLHVVAASRADLGPLGVPSAQQLKTTVYAIAAGDPAQTGEAPERLIARSIVQAGREHAERGELITFAALGQEMWAAPQRGDGLRWQGRVHEHPEMAEAILVYAVCGDGRRWRACRWHTGPFAGQTADVTPLIGRPLPDEAYGMPAAPLLRTLVGLGR